MAEEKIAAEERAAINQLRASAAAAAASAAERLIAEHHDARTDARLIDQAIADYRKRSGTKPGDIPEWIREKPTEFIDAVVKAKLPSTPRGPLSMDAYHNPINNLYVLRVDKPNHKVRVASIKRASQFWKENPKAFLEHPVFSRDYPKCC